MHLIATITVTFFFPLIHSKILTSNGFKEENIKYAAVSASDMRNIGGYQTTSIKSMLSEAHGKNTLIVLCGGDILSADWLLMLGNLSTPLINKAFRAGRKLMGIHITNILAKMLLGQRIFTHMSSAKRYGCIHYLYSSWRSRFQSQSETH